MSPPNDSFLSRLHSQAAWLLLLFLDGSLCLADSIVIFPEESVGELYCSEPERTFLGTDLYVSGLSTEWEFLAFAAGEVRLPAGKLIRLDLKSNARDTLDPPDASWIRRVPKNAIYSLHIVNVSISDDFFSELANWSEIQELQLTRCGLTSAICRDLEKLQSLKSIRISGLPEIDDELMRTLATLPQLQEVSIHKGKVTDAGLESLAHSGSITCVRAYSVAITNNGIAAISKLPKLTALDVYAPEPKFRDAGPNTSVTDIGLKQLERCKSLKSLNLCGARVSKNGLESLFRQCDGLRYLALSKSAIKIGALEAAAGLPSLERIRINDMEIDDAVAVELSKFKNLRKIEGQMRLGNKGVTAIASLRRLESLSFSGLADDQCCTVLAKLDELRELGIQNTGITDIGLSQLKVMPHIEKATLSGPSFSTGCLEVIVSWPKLKSLSLSQLSSRMDGKLEWIDLQHLKNTVRSIRIFNCPDIDDKQLGYLQESESIDSLEIIGNSLISITDEGARVVSKVPRLKQLTIRDSKITDSGMLALQSIETLEQLELAGLATYSGLERIGSLPRLRSLSVASPNLTPADIAKFREVSPRHSDLQFSESHFSQGSSLDAPDSIFRRGSVRERSSLNALEGKTAPPLLVKSWTSSHGEFQLQDLKGKVVLIDFWGQWCGACLDALPHIRELHDKYHSQGLVIVSIHSTLAAEGLNEFMKKSPFPWANCIDDQDKTSTAYAVDAWPSTYLIDRDGKLRIANPVPCQLEEAIQHLLNTNP